MTGRLSMLRALRKEFIVVGVLLFGLAALSVFNLSASYMERNLFARIPGLANVYQIRNVGLARVLVPKGLESRTDRDSSLHSDLARSSPEQALYATDAIFAWRNGSLTASQLHSVLGLHDAIIPAIFNAFNETFKGLEHQEGKPFFYLRPPIPVIGTNTVRNPAMLRRLVYSIDSPVQKVVIVFNSISGQQGKQDEMEMDYVIKELQHVLGRRYIHVIRSGCNRGCAGGWNSIIHATKDAPWWLIVNDDAAFIPGALSTLPEYINSDPDTVLFTLTGFQVFAVTRRGFQEVGLFDENIWPAYHEDCDYILRVYLSGLKVKGAPPEYGNIHGDVDSGYSSTHTASKDYELRNIASHDNNARYYSMKWNVTGYCGEIEDSMFRTPFNNPARSLSNWTFDTGLRQRQRTCWDPKNDVGNVYLEPEFKLAYVPGDCMAIHPNLLTSGIKSLWPKAFNHTGDKSFVPSFFEANLSEQYCVSPFAMAS
jgi:hypothetical protein